MGVDVLGFCLVGGLVIVVCFGVVGLWFRLVALGFCCEVCSESTCCLGKVGSVVGLWFWFCVGLCSDAFLDLVVGIVWVFAGDFALILVGFCRVVRFL